MYKHAICYHCVYLCFTAADTRDCYTLTLSMNRVSLALLNNLVDIVGRVFTARCYAYSAVLCCRKMFLCLTVRSCVTLQYCVKMAKPIIDAPDRPIILVLSVLNAVMKLTHWGRQYSLLRHSNVM